MGFLNFSASYNKNSDSCIVNNLSLSEVILRKQGFNGKHLVPSSSMKEGGAEQKKEDFFFWFSGFTDGEGNFLITMDRGFVKFRFKISLHVDDIEVLNTIKSKLNVGRVTVEVSRDRCSFIVEKYADIRNVICPIFNSYPLHTSKRLDFEDFNKAVLIKDSINKKLSKTDMERIIYLKNGMNSNREIFTFQTNKSQIIINPN
jgi:LAGLIDADG endonuclease